MTTVKEFKESKEMNCQTCKYRVEGELKFFIDGGRPTVGKHPDECLITGDKIKRPTIKKCNKYEEWINK